MCETSYVCPRLHSESAYDFPHVSELIEVKLLIKLRLFLELFTDNEHSDSLCFFTMYYNVNNFSNKFLFCTR